MKGQVASALVILALLAGAAVGYFWNTSGGITTTQTVATTYTTTLPGDIGVLRCVFSRYIVYRIAYFPSNETTAYTYGRSTQTTNLETYITVTSVIQTIGFATTYTANYSTYTGVLALANVTACTYIAG